ncbi:hypothetical protein C1645_873391 [Glomus cerebriforme]|uniref:Uncharacterized protein n=1 Tax=Glomus cerebriforme TaxID=658196 RepID=A0A397T9J6_9GLOM|nr:hypothetical protein C1645_873391 [Glomus cerebriforme]
MSQELVNFSIVCLIVAFLGLFFLFYINRVFAIILSRLIRVYTWRKYHAYIEIESLQFAPLAGRILFKNLKYRSINQSFSILKGHITVQYWLWNVRKEYQIQDNNGSIATDKDLPCRIVCHLDGVEWFAYNRTPAYDALESIINGLNSESSSNMTQNETEDITVNVNGNDIPEIIYSEESFFQKLLPIQIDLERGAIIFGNTNTPSLLVVEFSQASGIYAARKSRSRFDYYKSVLDLRFREPKIHLRTNVDYKEPENILPGLTRKEGFLSKLKNFFKNYITFWKSSRPADIIEWHGLPRYRADDELNNKDNVTDEYAKVSTILVCHFLEMTYYADVAGKVPRVPIPITDSEEIDIGNGDLSPEWGVELVFTGVQLDYGPWADRQRSILQNFFFPPIYRNAKQTKKLSPGQDRIHTSLKISIQFDDQVTLRIPMREPSKDLKYSNSEGRMDESHLPGNNRPYGWLAVNVDEDSVINMTLPMVFTEQGYSNFFDISLENVVVQSSVNFSHLLTAKQCKLRCDLPSPIIWNQTRKWDFDMHFTDARIYLLRDHITLLQDLIKDWTFGPSPDQLHFIPMEYQFNPRFTNFELFLNVNEHNIIDNPIDIEDNAFIIIKGPQLVAEVVIPLLQYNQEITKIRFDIEITKGKIVMSPPVSQTLGAFLTNDSKESVQISSFTIEGNYQYYSFVDPNHVESLSLYLKGKEVNLKLFGFVIRYFLILQMNYFGNYINFMTLEEYLIKHDPKNAKNNLLLQEEVVKSPADPFEVYMILVIEDGTLILPENLYSADNSSTVQFHELQVELRNLDVYMDMDVTVSPLMWTLSSDASLKKNSIKPKSSRDDNYNYLYIDDLNIYAHRLFGPLPKTATYVCNWDINIGTISGQLKPSFLLSVTSFARTFAHHFVDKENALPTKYVMLPDPDVTFLTVDVQEVDISIWGGGSVTQIMLKEGLSVKFDDLANEKYILKVIFNLPDLTIRSLAKSAMTLASIGYSKDAEYHPWVEVASFESAFNITLYRTTSGWRERLESQQAFIKHEDRETKRIPFLYGRDHNQDLLGSNGNHFGSLYTPPMPPPLPDDMDTSSVLYNESTNSSMVDLTANNSRKNMLDFFSINRFDFDIDNDDDDDESCIRTDCDSTSITGSGVSASNASFVTAKSDDSQYSDESDIDNLRNTNIKISGDSDSEYEENESDHSPIAEQNPMSPLAPRSIPYESYLKRYRLTHKRPFATSFPSSFLRPSRILFIPAREEEALSPDDENSQSYKSFPFTKTKSASTESFKDFQPEDETSSANSDVEEKLTIIFEAAKCIKISLTPIFLKIVEEFLEAIIDKNWHLEAMLDKIQIDYVEELTKLFPFKYTTIRFAASIPRIHLHFIQDVLLPDDLTNVNDEHPGVRTRYDLTDTILCAAADLILDQTLLTGLIKFEDKKFDNKDKTKNFRPSLELIESRANIDFDTLKLNVRFVTGSNSIVIFGIPERLHHFKESGFMSSDTLDNEPVVLIVELEQLKLRWMGCMEPNYFSFDIDRVAGIFISQSIEILLGGIYWWLVFAEDLANLLKKFQTHRTRQLQVLVYEIAKFSEKTTNENDPPYLTRPSHVLRLGTKNFKNDDGWKILGRVRHCKTLMQTERIDELYTILNNSAHLLSMDPNEMYGRVLGVFSKWRHWEMENLSNCHLFTDLFQQPIDKSSINDINDIYRFVTISTNFVKIRIGNIALSIWDGHKENSVVVYPIELDLETKFHKDNLPSSEVTRRHVDSNASNTEQETPQILNSLFTGYLDVILRIGIDQIGLDVNPDMLAFAKHWLKVHRVFSSKFQSLSKEPVIQSEEVIPTTKIHKHKQTPTITSFHDIKLSKKKRKDTVTESISSDPIKDLSSRLNIFAHGIIILKTIIIKASAQNLMAQTQLSNLKISSWFNNPQILNSSDKLDLENVSINKSPGSRSSGGKGSNRLIFSTILGIESILASISHSSGNNTLLSIEFSKISSDASLSLLAIGRPKSKIEIEPRKVLSILLTLEEISVKLPQSLLKLYNFVEEWRAENLSSYDFLYKTLLDELEEQRKSTPKSTHPGTREIRTLTEKNLRNSLEIKFQFLMKKFSIQTHMLPSLRFHYDAWDLFIILEKSTSALGDNLINYSGQLSKQVIHFVTRQKHKNKSEKSNDDETDDRHQKGAFTIPAIRATGNIKSCEPRKSGVSSKKTAIHSANSVAPSKYSKLESSVTLDFVKLNLNVNIIDNLLTAHSTLGSELNDILDVFLFSSRKLKERGDASKEKSSVSSKDNDTLFYNLKISLIGLRISAMSPNAVGFFETNILNGLITNVSSIGFEKSPKVQWKFSAQNFSLSLNHKTGIMSQADTDDDIRKYRIAYIMIDLALQNFKNQQENSDSISKSEEDDESIESYFLKLLKVHAVMQPIALGRLMDLYVYYSGELERRKKMKASDIDKLTANTQRILNSLDVEMPKYKSKSKSFLDEKVLSLDITRFAIALPLDLHDDLISTSAQHLYEHSQIPAFLFSISSMNFRTRKLKSNCAILKDLSLQFVTQFDQGNEDHFSSYFHPNMNRIFVPEISCEGQTTGTIDKKKIYVESRVEGFRVDVGGNIVNHINSLSEIYAASRERLETFTTETNFNIGSQSQSQKPSNNEELNDDSGSPNIVELEIEATFTAKSGTIKLYPKNYFTKHHNRRPTETKDRSKSARGSRGSIVSITLPRLNLDGLPNYAPTSLDDLTRQGEHGVDNIIIPGLSLNTFYRTIIGQRVVPSPDALTKRVHVELIIHPSENILYPSLVPFFKDIIDGLKIGVQRSSDKKAIAVQESSSPIQGVNFTCYFRLSRTTFDLSCQPASKVACSLKWEEGNFLISFNAAEEAVQSITCVGKIRGASGNIRHAFSPEDCVRAETKNISFNVTLMSRRTESVSDDSISIIVELPQITAELNIRHLQDLLLLKTIWIDQATKLYEVSGLSSQQSSRPVSGEYFNGDKASLSSSSSLRSVTSFSEDETKVKPYSVYIMVRLNQLDLSCDLGQAIGKVQFNTKNIQVRTKNVPGVLKTATATTDCLGIKCEGRLAGSANMKGLTFTTILGIPPKSESDGSICVTNLLFKTERIQSFLEYEYQKILVLEVDPIQFKLTDCWKIISPEKASVLIHANVSVKRIQAIVAIKTIPSFLHMTNKLLALVEEKRISASNVILNSNRSPYLIPNSQSQTNTTPPMEPNKLSPQETSNSPSYKELLIGGLLVHPVGKITIAMEKVYLTIFPNHFYDTDCVQTRFDGLLIDLERSIEEGGRVNRKLDMQLNGIALLKSNCRKLNHKNESLTFQNWFDHVENSSSKNIFTLPSTHLIMDTAQGIGSNIVDHKFYVDFRGKVDVALNFGLIRYLQELRALYKEQLRKNIVGAADIPIVSPSSSPVDYFKSNPLIQVQQPTSPVLSGSPTKETKVVQSSENEDSKEVKMKDAIIFNPVEPVKLEPQLRILGDATPPLEWVGVQRAKIPGFVHTAITMNLDEIINKITNESFKAAQTLL